MDTELKLAFQTHRFKTGGFDALMNGEINFVGLNSTFIRID